MFAKSRGAVFREVSSIPGPIALLGQAIQEITSRRRLIRYLVGADMKKRGSDTVLGNLWWIFDPLLQMLVYVIFVTIIARKTTPDYPLFIFAAILPWKWYQTVVTDATLSVVRQEKLIKQIAFPKIVLPISTATAEVVGFAWGLIPLFALMLFFADRISIQLLWIPVIAAVQYVFSVASAILMAAANVFFRDLGNITVHALRLWWYLSPGLYALDSLKSVGIFQDHHTLLFLFGLNPFATLFEAYRSVIYGTVDGLGPPHPPDLMALGILMLASLVFLALAMIFFKRLEPSFAKVL